VQNKPTKLSPQFSALKRFFSMGVVACGLFVAGQNSPAEVGLGAAESVSSSLASMDFGSVDDLVQTLTPQAKIQRAAPNTWSSRAETRFKARWSGESKYVV
jgi:hypothetical protein